MNGTPTGLSIELMPRHARRTDFLFVDLLLQIVQLVNVAKISIKTSSVPFSSVPFKVHGPGEVLTDSDFPWADLKASCEFCKKKEPEGHKFQVCSKCKRVKYCSGKPVKLLKAYYCAWLSVFLLGDQSSRLEKVIAMLEHDA